MKYSVEIQLFNQKNMYMFSFYTKNITVHILILYMTMKQKGQLLEASVCTPLCSRLSSTLLQLMAELLRVRILQ